VHPSQRTRLTALIAMLQQCWGPCALHFAHPPDQIAATIATGMTDLDAVWAGFWHARTVCIRCARACIAVRFALLCLALLLERIRSIM
jgi:hypothetical protein